MELINQVFRAHSANNSQGQKLIAGHAHFFQSGDEGLPIPTNLVLRTLDLNDKEPPIGDGVAII